MSVFEIRRQLRLEGWLTKDEYSWFGWGGGECYGYSVWVQRWDWHGNKLGVSVSFGGVIREPETEEQIIAVWEKAATKARKAWEEFPFIPPETLADGSMRENVVIKSLYEKGQWYAKPAN